ncbi:E3 ubiquitin-protein transferase RMND5, partial [Tremellales sp. Uapishka_1]
MDLQSSLHALEQLASCPSTSSSGPLDALLDIHLTQAKQRLLDGEDPKAVLTELQKTITRTKKEVEKGLKGWYGALGNVGKAVEKSFPSYLAAISEAYDDPPLFSDAEAKTALDRVVLESLGRRGLWDAVDAMEDETGLMYDLKKRRLSEELHRIIADIDSGDLSSALLWCSDNAAFLRSPPHPSPLPYHLHRSIFLSIADAPAALLYARQHLLSYIPTQPVLELITSSLYVGSPTPPKPRSPYALEKQPLIQMFIAEFCRLHQWPKEEPLEVVVDLGSRGGALNVIEKARRVMGERLGKMEVPLPPSLRYHSVFVCPVSKDQATEANPPKMLMCGHVLAQDSCSKILGKMARRTIKCPYCPMETSPSSAQRLYF